MTVPATRSTTSSKGRSGHSRGGRRASPNSIVSFAPDLWDVALVATGIVLAVSLRSLTFLADSGIYVRMAQHPFENVTLPPFSYRVATPWIAAALPFHLLDSFTILSTTSMVLAAMILRRTTDALSQGRQGVVAGFGLLGSGTALYGFRTPYMTDPLALLTTVATLEAIRRRSWFGVMLLVTIGIPNRELALFLLLPAVVHLVDWQRLRSNWRIVLMSVVPLALYLVLHMTTALYGTRLGPNRTHSLSFILAWNAQRHGPLPVYVASVFVVTFGAFWLFMPRAVFRSRGYVAHSLLYLIPTFGGLFVALDWRRLLAAGIVVVLPTVLSTLAHRRSAVVLVVANSLGAFLIVTSEGKYVWLALAVVVAGGIVALLIERLGVARRPTLPTFLEVGS